MNIVNITDILNLDDPHGVRVAFLAPVATTPFNISGIEWKHPNANLPTHTCLDLPDSLVNLSYEDFESPDATDDFTEDDWDEYEPSSEAEAALDAEWDRVITELLEAKFSATIVAIGGFEPA